MHESNSEKYKGMLSGVGSGGSGYFIDGIEIPVADWDENQEFDAYGRPIPISANKPVIEANPKFMTAPEGWTDDEDSQELLRLEEAAKAAEAWKKELQRWMKASAELQKENKKIAELEQGMLTARLEAEAERKALEVEAKAKEAEAKRIADAEAKANISKDVVKDLDEDSGRSKPVKMKNLRGEKPGFVMAEGTNWWSVDEKDDYWQTKEGHKEAMKLYGQKPSWVKESTLEYNPKTGKYDSIEKEEFVEIKPKKRISL